MINIKIECFLCSHLFVEDENIKKYAASGFLGQKITSYRCEGFCPRCGGDISKYFLKDKHNENVWSKE